MHQHPCPISRRRAILLIVKIFCRTYGCDGAPGEVLDVFETSPLVKLQLEGKGGEGTMDAGPSHSRPVFFACLLTGRFYSPASLVFELMRLHRSL